MAKVKKMADGGITGLGSMISNAASTIRPATNKATGSNGGGGGGSAQDGLDQIGAGAGTVSNAINSASSALSGGSSSGGSVGSAGGPFDSVSPLPNAKRGGSIKKYSSGGKIDLKNCGVSTASKGKTNSNW